ncbi:MAG: hypothetical protein ACI841_000312 [Planctomycetota bacterium]
MIYKNQTPISYFSTVQNHKAAGGYRVTDSGRIPSLSDTGDGDVYRVDGIEMSYCSSADVGPSLTVEYRFDENQGPCQGSATGSSSVVTLAGMPFS